MFVCCPSSALFCPNSPQASGRYVAHYHCVVCSVTIARKTDMVSHLKRHVNKGETEASYSGSSDVLLEEPGNKRRRRSCFVSGTLVVDYFFCCCQLVWTSASSVLSGSMTVSVCGVWGL